ncbi:hypothetical protein I3842_02G001500 [Carya illinoinensis]|uniref:BSD domain-containing protein n=1 Tax=Carya illinoinensis TaxID=32201 RepID=A0A922FQQ7_CARIL|nr:hypothetical protein I3842_02G001500 [Carya illinoinensis]
MSWIARSIANSLKLDDGDDNTTANASDPNSPQKQKLDSPSSPSTPSSRGVKEDLSDLTKTVSRQLWGVASFLAPPPQPSDHKASEEDMISGIRSDFAEISGKFKTGISKLSTNKTVSEITKIASNFLLLGSEEEIGDAVGVTEEVLAFARNVSMHPETWLDFPLPDYEDSDEFEMSDAQQEHALAIERLAPSLAALRIELCPGYMSEACFWMIYFVLLHPRLGKHDAELLSTPKIVEARTMLTHDLQSRNKAKQEPEYLGRDMNTTDLTHEEHLSVLPGASESAPLKTSAVELSSSSVPADIEMEKHPVQSTELEIVDKSVVKDEPVDQTMNQHSLPGSSSRVLDDKFEDDGDDWLKEESSEMVGVSGTTFPIGNDEDVSFSDLEEDDGDVPINYTKATTASDSSTKDSRDWVQLSRSSADSVKDISSVEIKNAGSEQISARNPESKEPNDWLNLDDIDVI